MLAIIGGIVLVLLIVFPMLIIGHLFSVISWLIFTVVTLGGLSLWFARKLHLVKRKDKQPEIYQEV